MRDIEARTFRFAVAIVNMVKAMPNSIASNVIARQIMRAGTSVGANVEEAGVATELSSEADQLVRILTAIVKNSRQPS